MTYLKQKHKAVKLLNEIVVDEDLEYADNYRVALKDDDYDEMIYKSLQNRGCCGSIDREVEIDGVTWKIGCNFGH